MLDTGIVEVQRLYINLLSENPPPPSFSLSLFLSTTHTQKILVETLPIRSSVWLGLYGIVLPTRLSNSLKKSNF